MKQYIALISALALAACGGGSGGGHGDGLTPAEHLFGAGIGTGQTPTHIIPREDGAGFEILSFGAWGNVYDIKETTNYSLGLGPVDVVNIHNVALYDFLGQQKLDIATNYKSLKDASVANSTFVGPAIVYLKDTTAYCSTCFPANDSDYGTMKLQFGQDIDNATIEFVMHNPENNLTVPTETWDNNPYLRFTTDRQNVAVGYETTDKAYIGYGSKR